MAACGMMNCLWISLILGFGFLSIAAAEGREHLVGGKADAWNIADSDSLNKWAQNSRFQVGDYLVWKYDSTKDSVLQVTRDAYLSCNTTSPVEEHKDNEGETKLKLDHSGPYYFISGAQGHCDKGQKLIVVVMAPRHHHRFIMAPSPSPTSFLSATGATTPAPSPVSGAPSLRRRPILMLIALALGGAMVFVQI